MCFFLFNGGIDVLLNSNPSVRNWPFFNAFFSHLHKWDFHVEALVSINTKANNWNSIVSANGTTAWRAGKYATTLFYCAHRQKNICRNLGRRRFWHVGLFEVLYLHIIFTVTSVLFWEHRKTLEEDVLRKKGTSGSSAVTTRGSTSHWPVMWPLTLNNHMLCKAGKGRYCEKFIKTKIMSLKDWFIQNIHIKTAHSVLCDKTF